MQQALTKAEEDVMRYVWELGECSVGQIRDAIAAKTPDAVPAHSTVSTLLKLLRDKEYIGYRAFGRTFVYYPLVQKDAYSRKKIKRLLGRFFGGSPARLVSFLVEENDLSLEELTELTKTLGQALPEEDQALDFPGNTDDETI